MKGDACSANIAAASILAKVSRDRLMLELDKLYPEYQFCQTQRVWDEAAPGALTAIWGRAPSTGVPF